MKIFLAHNKYQVSGGEDSVFENETKLLEERGDFVRIFCLDNSKINSVWSKVSAFFSVFFSISQFIELKNSLAAQRPDVVHVHNYFPLISPAIFYVCKVLRIPVVHTLHNYRSVCPTAFLLRDGEVEERSLRGGTWWAIKARAYRGSLVGTIALVLAIELHKRLKTWHTSVDRFIALTEFSRKKFIEAGWPAEKIVVKPNFVDDPFPRTTIGKSGGYGLFVGRLSEEKGVRLLFDAWGEISLPLYIAGDGPLSKWVSEHSGGSIKYLGRMGKVELFRLLQDADFIVVPSVWYETFGMVVVEAFACGTPVIVSNLGSLPDIVEHGVTGLHFEVGDSDDLADKIQWMIDNPGEVRAMGENARKEYLRQYTAEKNYSMLKSIYEEAVEATYAGGKP